MIRHNSSWRFGFVLNATPCRPGLRSGARSRPARSSPLALDPGCPLRSIRRDRGGVSDVSGNVMKCHEMSCFSVSGRIPLPLGEGRGEGLSAAVPMSDPGAATGSAYPSPDPLPQGEGRRRVPALWLDRPFYPACFFGGLAAKGCRKRHILRFPAGTDTRYCGSSTGACEHFFILGFFSHHFLHTGLSIRSRARHARRLRPSAPYRTRMAACRPPETHICSYIVLFTVSSGISRRPFHDAGALRRCPPAVRRSTA